MALFASKTKTINGTALKVETVTQVSVTLDNVPGELAKLASALAEANVSIDGLCRTDEPGGVVTDHFVVDNVAKARQVFASLGKESWPIEILKLTCLNDRPGVIAAIAAKFGSLGINIENIFHTSVGRGHGAVMYVAVKPGDLEKALAAAKEII
ncbi:MAG: ACT domain-containing protein [Patescibacteria group bacterium]